MPLLSYVCNNKLGCSGPDATLAVPSLSARANPPFCKPSKRRAPFGKRAMIRGQVQMRRRYRPRLLNAYCRTTPRKQGGEGRQRQTLNGKFAISSRFSDSAICSAQSNGRRFTAAPVCPNRFAVHAGGPTAPPFCTRSDGAGTLHELAPGTAVDSQRNAAHDHERRHVDDETRGEHEEQHAAKGADDAGKQHPPPQARARRFFDLE